MGDPFFPSILCAVAIFNNTVVLLESQRSEICEILSTKISSKLQLQAYINGLIKKPPTLVTQRKETRQMYSYDRRRRRTPLQKITSLKDYTYNYKHWVDVSDEQLVPVLLSGLPTTFFMQLKADISFEESQTKRDFRNHKQTISEERGNILNCSVKYKQTVHVKDLKRQFLVTSETHGFQECFFSLKCFAIASIIGFSWPYRMIFWRCLSQGEFTIKKIVTNYTEQEVRRDDTFWRTEPKLFWYPRTCQYFYRDFNS